MSEKIHYDHPKQRLLFFVAQDLTEEIPSAVERAVREISFGRSWVIGPPEFIDEIHASNLGTPVRTIGGFLLIYSALPPYSIPAELDESHFLEVSWLVQALQHFSLRHKLAFEFELDGIFVGSVEDGKIDRTLAEGLLGEWDKELKRRKGSR